jgi:hypothetical protein
MCISTSAGGTVQTYRFKPRSNLVGSHCASDYQCVHVAAVVQRRGTGSSCSCAWLGLHARRARDRTETIAGYSFCGVCRMMCAATSCVLSIQNADKTCTFCLTLLASVYLDMSWFKLGHS